MRRRKRSKKIELPRKAWFIYDEISEELWGPKGWEFRPCDMFVYESEAEALKAFRNGPHKKLGAVIGCCDTEEDES